MDLSPDEEHFQGRLLHQAALWDNLELLQELLSNGAEVDARDGSARSALHAAALAERSRCLAALCAAGADLDARCDDSAGGKTALHIAAERGHVENVSVLVRAGAALHARDAAGRTPLALAELHHHRHAAHALREARDALERERLSVHAQLRDMVVRGEWGALKSRLAALGSEAGLVANLTPGGANTLLYVAAESGATAAVSALLEAGADGRAHPVTKYSPLYVACYHGRGDIARLLLAHFPRAVQQETVEKWLPLHAACIGGHAAVVTLLLEYPYPPDVLNTYTEPSGRWQYRGAFDVNARDARGQTPLYVASTLGNVPVLAALLAHTVACERVHQSDDEQSPPSPGAGAGGAGEGAGAVLSPQRGGISLGIHAIVSRLTGNVNGNAEARESCRRLRPARVDAVCAGDSCVAAAARGGHLVALQRLLAAGAPADAPAAPPEDAPAASEGPRETRRSRSASYAGSRASPSPSPSPSPARSCNNDREGGWTALWAATRARHVLVAEALLNHGATDPQCRALREAAKHGLLDLMAKLLATKAYPDPEHKLNKSAMSESVFRWRDADPQLTYAALCPTQPVIVGWRELRCQLAHLRMSWLACAALRVNPRVGSGAAALHALTRLDVANNELRVLPPELFSLISLKYLNAAQNKLERLPGGEGAEDAEEEGEGRRRGRRRAKRVDVYTAPVLQELYLQDNRLEELPAALLSLPQLGTLDVSNNKLRALPGRLWAAPALRDLNAALNHLRDLPPGPEYESERSGQPASPSDASPQQDGSPSSATSPSDFGDQSKSSSRSPSIEHSETELQDDDDGVPVLGNRAGNAVWCEARRAHPWRGAVCASGAVGVAAGGAGAGGVAGGGSALASLNLSHNQFVCVPAVLACRAPSLTRLNMAYNSLRTMSYVTSYPTSLRQLDLSHNEITCWPSLPQLENFGSAEGDPLACYCPQASGRRAGRRPRSGGSVRAQLLSAACPARRHLRLEGLRTLVNPGQQPAHAHPADDGRRREHRRARRRAPRHRRRLGLRLEPEDAAAVPAAVDAGRVVQPAARRAARHPRARQPVRAQPQREQGHHGAAAADGAAVAAVEPEHGGLRAGRAAALDGARRPLQEHGHRRLPQVRAAGGAPLHLHEAHAGGPAGHRKDQPAGVPAAGVLHPSQEEAHRALGQAHGQQVDGARQHVDGGRGHRRVDVREAARHARARHLPHLGLRRAAGVLRDAPVLPVAALAVPGRVARHGRTPRAGRRAHLAQVYTSPRPGLARHHGRHTLRSSV